ncbi:RISC-loading complex subunit tarbp2-like isoform X1 [Sitophilus oryzae]|uniref:RISC-loading complex subunit tarbp2-like isoform X1 n=1 Tax=Sitophilus oryzae TaxID=7048 RepID=A0A6J2YE30_SITOR|nr:RISC-loading complex subunit tarbp2-like isoform X1 [Sitophilus oryzae]
MEPVGHMISQHSTILPVQPPSTPHYPHPRKNKTSQKHLPSMQTLTLTEEAKLVYNNDVNGTKTPVSVLQELLCRRGITPKYELVQIEGAIHEPVFRYRVFLNNEFAATGTGRSKKDAKHSAAKNLLDLLVGKQSAEQANQSNGTPGAPDITTQVVSPYDDKVMGNPIGWLQEMCMSKRWPPPFYNKENEKGLPHEREFTVSCQVLKFREEGTGKSKKLAKRLAAQKMWQALRDMPSEGNLLESDEEAGKLSGVHRYSGLKDSKITILSNQQSQKVSNFHKKLKQAAGPKLNELQTVNLKKKDFDYVKFLQEIGKEQSFEVTYVDVEEKSFIGKSQCLVQLSTLPVAVCYGCGETLADAQADAAHNALEYLRIMTKK